MKTSELTGAELDYWVAKAEGRHYQAPSEYTPSSQWAWGGPIIERERISTINIITAPGSWLGQCDYGDNRIYFGCGPTPLIAAMRAYVSSVFGQDVDASGKEPTP